MTEQLEGQMSLFAQDMPFTKTCQVHCPQTKERTSDASSKKRQGSFKKMPLFLDLTTANGHTPAASWEMGGALLGEYTMPSFGEYPKEENESHLSQILQDTVPEKYSLSEKACRGILTRANRRGKALPDVLREALEKQANVYEDS